MFNNDFKKWIYIGCAILFPSVIFIIAGLFTVKTDIFGNVSLDKSLDGFSGMILIGIGMGFGVPAMIFILVGILKFRKGKTKSEIRSERRLFTISHNASLLFILVCFVLPFHSSTFFLIGAIFEFIPLISIIALAAITYKMDNNTNNQSRFS